ncbi:hypothetical protein [Actinophytocola xanthii]|uniref:hypothetical protein n=1 Tax=Actinophytocola xanthii TaxID=1912961 RepID=UPI001178A0E9|nr:hypothetical protein [Actinophytocola xanthii]
MPPPAPANYCDACDWPTADGRHPGTIGADGRPTIDLEKLAQEGIDVSATQWELFENGSDEDRARMLDPVPGWQAQSAPTFSTSGHLLFDLIGLVPVLGEWADGVNCGSCGIEGDAKNAAGASYTVAGRALHKKAGRGKQGHSAG